MDKNFGIYLKMESNIWEVSCAYNLIGVYFALEEIKN